MRKSVVGLVGVAVALMITACGSVGSVASSVIGPCPPMIFDDVEWSLDGQYIAYHSHFYGPPYELVVIRPDGSVAKRIDTSQMNGLSSIQWLSDGSTLSPVFVATDTVHTINLDGTVTEIHIDAENVSWVLPSPDGKLLVYNTRLAGIVTGIDIINSDGSGYLELSNTYDFLQRWSPDGTRIAYIHEQGYKKYVATMRADGSDKRQLAEGVGPVHWSPDGQWLSYFSANDYSIHIISVDGSGDKLITSDVDDVDVNENMGAQFEWLPDSQHISFVSDSPDNFLKVINVSTLAVENLTTTAVSPFVPLSWSPDGTRVAFLGSDPAIQNKAFWDIYIMSHDGTGQTRLTDNPGRYQCFTWPF